MLRTLRLAILGRACAADTIPTGLAPSSARELGAHIFAPNLCEHGQGFAQAGLGHQQLHKQCIAARHKAVVQNVSVLHVRLREIGYQLDRIASMDIIPQLNTCAIW
jgi:hypothetical protein